jgi:hypothetical protein
MKYYFDYSNEEILIIGSRTLGLYSYRTESIFIDLGLKDNSEYLCYDLNLNLENPKITQAIVELLYVQKLIIESI